MSDIFVSIISILLLGSVLLFCISLVMLFFENYRKLAVKIMIGCVIAFVIGFGACVVGITMN